MIVIDLSKQQALASNPNLIPKINITGKLDQPWNTTIFFTIKEAKETVLDLSQGTMWIL